MTYTGIQTHQIEKSALHVFKSIHAIIAF